MSNPPAYQLRTETLSIGAGPIELLDKLSFTLEAGDGLILRGPNGSGKTTLLRTLAGLHRPSKGTIKFGKSESPEDFTISGNCHFLGHKNGLKGTHNVRQNLDFFMTFSGQKTIALNDIASILNIKALLDVPVSLLSAGQARRTAFARLLIERRPIWCLDEPTAALDEHSASSVERLAQEHLASGGILIASTHGDFLAGNKNCRTLSTSDYTPRHNEDAPT